MYRSRTKKRYKKTGWQGSIGVARLYNYSKYLSRSVTESLVHAFITSRIDYCNSLLYGLPNSHIMKLQRIQNAEARLVTRTPRFCHVTPLFFHLHWLPINYRIKFKILLLTFKCLHGQAQLISLLSKSNPGTL